MSLNDVYTKAAIELGDSLPVVIGLCAASIGFFLKNAFGTTESNRRAIADINKDLGLLDAARERSKERDEQHDLKIHELEKDMRDVLERLAVLDHEAKK